MKEYPEVSEKTIWNFRQNNPELIIRDAEEYLGLTEEQCEILRKILLARGVNKWFKVRRDIIAFKKMIKHEIKESNNNICEIKKNFIPGNKEDTVKYITAKEMLKYKEYVRGTLKKLCMTDRMQIWPKRTGRKTALKMNTLKCSD